MSGPKSSSTCGSSRSGVADLSVRYPSERSVAGRGGRRGSWSASTMTECPRPCSSRARQWVVICAPPTIGRWALVANRIRIASPNLRGRASGGSLGLRSARMRILDVSPRVVDPPTRGSTVRIYNLLRQLSQRHEVRQFSQTVDRLALRESVEERELTPTYREYRYSSPRAWLA